MKTVFVLLMLLFPTTDEPFVSPLFEGRERINPELEVVWPIDGGRWSRWVPAFVLEVENFDYLPDLASNPVMEFATGADAAGVPLKFAEGHFHGWVFRVDRKGRKIREDAGFPLPSSYLRFYGATAGEYFGNRDRAYIVVFDDFEPGEYVAYFQLQQNDHTAALQASAPALPAFDKVRFRVTSFSRFNR